ncbi:MAG TPA: hypothetical protein VJV78_46965, partial [Polyangiales bacterium]|nr:hypothetical protein [Polyangiales bacterium]
RLLLAQAQARVLEQARVLAQPRVRALAQPPVRVPVRGQSQQASASGPRACRSWRLRSSRFARG